MRFLQFQFQYGAIIRKEALQELKGLQEFQFQYGAIISFRISERCVEGWKFQFQYGAIISKSNCIVTKNSIYVSIPIWCDYK